MKPTSTLSVFAAMNRRDGEGKVTFRRDGDAYELSNGMLAIRGEMCGAQLAHSILLGGHDCGSLNIMLKVSDGDGGWVWPGIMSLCSVSYCEAENAGVLDLIGDWWRVIGKWTIPGLALRVRVRLVVRPGESAFLCEIVGIDNSGTKDLSVSRAFITVMPPRGVKPLCVRQPSEVENSAVWDAGDGFAIGLRSEDEGVQRLSFWVDSKSLCPHADCGFSMPGGRDIVLHPGCRWTPSCPMGAIVFLLGE